ncbi:MAG: type I-U CRISPR-associated protein Csb2, partial [Pirellulales bacterium]|nr:type I-U CRISPR-associated protein Csb2 [Pirellulales bacterium]
PAWLTGHEPDGRSTSKPHIAFVPLPFVDSEYADGHILGLAMVLPRDLSDEDKSEELADLLVDESLEPRPYNLTLGNNGVWQLKREERTTPPQALIPETWTRPSHVWATVTPIVLDRHPKTDRLKDIAGWRSEVSTIVCRSCQHIGLPNPTTIQIEKHAFLKGVPSSRPGRTGFPLMSHSDGKTRRIQTHAILTFDTPVQGPVILGAGRFRGYGFCKPVASVEKGGRS